MPSLSAILATAEDDGDLAWLRYQWRAVETAVAAATGAAQADEVAFTEELLRWMSTHRDSHIPFLARRHGRPVGMVWLALVERIPGPDRFVRRSGYVQSTYVMPDERNDGVGTLLVRRLLDHAQLLDLDYLAVHPSERAFPFYRRLGFADSGRVLELRR